MTQAQMPRATQKAGQTTPKAGEQQQTFLDHLHELRRRLFAVAATLLAGTLVGYALHDQIIHALLRPLNAQKLVYLTPGGGFDFIFKVALYFGATLTIPMAVYQLYKYLSPIIGTRSRRFAVFVVSTSCLLAALGISFGYFFALPAALKFLTGFAGNYVEASLTASSYLNFVTTYSLGLAALFQIPLVLLLVNTINGPLKPSTLMKSQPYMLLGSVILAAMITPTPDIINQAIVAAPVVIMYELGVVMVLVQNRNRPAKQQQTSQLKFVPPQTATTQRSFAATRATPVSRPAITVATQAKPAKNPTSGYGMAPTPRPRTKSTSAYAGTRPAPALNRPQRRIPSQPGRSIDGFYVPRNIRLQAIDTAGNKP